MFVLIKAVWKLKDPFCQNMCQHLKDPPTRQVTVNTTPAECVNKTNRILKHTEDITLPIFGCTFLQALLTRSLWANDRKERKSSTFFLTDSNEKWLTKHKTLQNSQSFFVGCTKWHNWKGIFHSETCGWKKSEKCSRFFFKSFICTQMLDTIQVKIRVKHLLAGIALKATSCILNMLQLHFLHLKQCWENIARQESLACLFTTPPKRGPSCLCLIYEQPGKRERRFLDLDSTRECACA